MGPPIRKYCPPPDSQISISDLQAQGLRRKSEELHEWSLYRQNLTSTIASGLLQPTLPHSIPSPSNVTSIQNKEYKMNSTNSSTALHYATNQKAKRHYVQANNYNHVHQRPRHGVPYNVLSMPRESQGHYMDDNGTHLDKEVYLKFGLPRIHIRNNPQTPRAQEAIDHSSRKAQSELDMRKVGVPVVMNHNTNQNRFASVDGLDQNFNEPSPSFYDQTEFAGPSTSAKHVFDVTDFQRAPPSPSPDEDTSIVYGGGFFQSKRHHAHYFSNLDLFASANNAYNYLRYAKAEELNGPTSKTPHLMLRSIGFEKDRRNRFDKLMLRDKSPNFKRVLSNVSLQMFGGETLALMYTSEEEVTTLLNMMSDMNIVRGRSEGTFLVNGVPMKSASLGRRVAYVSSHELYDNLTVKEHLKLTSAFVKPATDAFRTTSMITQLIQTLALAPFQNRLVGELGTTEKQRVKVACQILLDTDIIVLHNICKQMDLYDAAFLIDYLRDWACKLNRIVIMAINPPTAEILVMFHKAAILASGRIIYFGSSSTMTNYFESLDYPCPLFKNPCDYYVDLVTHDYLTPDAAVESWERIRRLGDIWLTKAPPLTDSAPPSIPPAAVRKATPPMAVIWIFLRFWMILLNCPWQYIRELLYSGLLSLILGTVYFNSPVEQRAGIQDRFGFFYALLILMLIPNLWLNIERISSERSLLFVDVQKNLYGKLSFFIAKLIFDLPFAFLSYCFYIIPAYYMALHSQSTMKGETIFAVYVSLTLLYCYSLRIFAWVFTYACLKKSVAAASLGAFVVIFSLSCGLSPHPNDQWLLIHYINYISPTHWIYMQLVNNEFNRTVSTGAVLAPPRPGERGQRVLAPPTAVPLKFQCPKEIARFARPGVAYEIVTAQSCPELSGPQILNFAKLDLELIGPENTLVFVAGVLASCIVMSLICNCFCIYCNHRPKRVDKHKTR